MNFDLKKIARDLWQLRAKISLDFPIPCFLPYGCLCLAYGDGMGAMFFFRRPYEKNEWRFISKFVKPGFTFLDIGANQGFYTLLAAKLVGPNGRVIAFEPLPVQAKRLKGNVRINFFKNVKVEQVALDQKSGFADMFACLDGSEPLSSLRPISRDLNIKSRVIKVPTVSLDDYVKKSGISSIDFIKIDVEGGELDVLKGAMNTIKKFRPIIMCEVQDVRTQQWGYSSSEILNFLKDCGYSWFKFTDGGMLGSYKFEEKQEIKDVNFIAVPSEKNDRIKEFLI
jgi:FkbM family methyltransferase